MAKKEYINNPAGINDEYYALNIMNMAVEPERKSTRVERGPEIAKESISSAELDEGVAIKAVSKEKERD